MAMRLDREDVDAVITRMLKPISAPLHQIEEHAKPPELSSAVCNWNTVGV